MTRYLQGTERKGESEGWPGKSGEDLETPPSGRLGSMIHSGGEQNGTRRGKSQGTNGGRTVEKEKKAGCAKGVKKLQMPPQGYDQMGAQSTSRGKGKKNGNRGERGRQPYTGEVSLSAKQIQRKEKLVPGNKGGQRQTSW